MKEIEIKEEVKKEFTPKPSMIRFASLYLDVSKYRTREEISKEIKTCRKTTWNWFQNPDFVRWLNTQKDKLLETALIPIYMEAIRKAKHGHFNFAKLLLEMAGAYQPGLKIDTGQTAELIKIEIVQAQKQEQKQEGPEVKNEND